MAIKKLGTIVNFFGLKGQLKVSISTSQPEERFKVGNKIIIKNNMNDDEEYEISFMRMKDKRIAVIGLTGYDDINDIQSFIGKDIFANVRAPKGSFFFDELVGMKVVSDKGEEIGIVDNIQTMPAGDYLVIKNKIYIQFKMDIYIQSVDKKTKTITLTELGTQVTK